jgi:hypothetical protein
MAANPTPQPPQRTLCIPQPSIHLCGRRLPSIVALHLAPILCASLQNYTLHSQNRAIRRKNRYAEAGCRLTWESEAFVGNIVKSRRYCRTAQPRSGDLRAGSATSGISNEQQEAKLFFEAALYGLVYGPLQRSRRQPQRASARLNSW